MTFMIKIRSNFYYFILIFFTIVLFITILDVNLCGTSIEGKSINNEKKIESEITKNCNTGTYIIEKKIYHSDFYNLKSGFMDKEKNIFVIDIESCEIFKFSSKGQLLKKIGRKGYGPGENVMPTKILSYNNKIIVIDYMIPYINIYDNQLNLLEQKKLDKLAHPFDASIINENEFIVTSTTMPLVYKHKYFIFGFNKTFNKKVKVDYGSTDMKKNVFNFKFPPFVCFDNKTKTFWSAESGSYMIEHYDKDFNLKKRIKNNIGFKFEESGVGPRNQYAMKMPKDKGIFFDVVDGKLFYAYLLDEMVILDLILNENSVYRFKLTNCRRILYLIDAAHLLINTYELKENESSEEIDKIEIIKLNY